MKLHATGRDLLIKESERLVSGSINIYTCEFTFDESWDGYTVTAVFSTGNRLVNMAVVDGKCDIPTEVLRPNARVRIGIFGIDGVRSRPTTYSEWIPVEQGADVTGTSAQPPTPSVYEQWLRGLDEKQDEWNGNEEARAEAEAARVVAENARVEAETKREAQETGYVAQAQSWAKEAEDQANDAERWANKAQEIVGGDFATKAQAQAMANTAESNANTYTDQQIAAIPTPDVSGQINTHNTSGSAHADIRQAITDALGNVYTKTETLADDTKALFGLDSGAVPDDVLNVLSKTMVTGETEVQTEVMFEPWKAAECVYSMYTPMQSLLCIDGEFYAAAGTSSSLLHSKDGNKWNRLSYIHSDPIASLRYINGNLIATHGDIASTSGSRYTYVSVSKDMGATWEHNSFNINGSWADIAYGNGVYVMVPNCYPSGAANYIAKSTDLKTWTSATLPVGHYWKRILYGNGKFVVFSNGNTIVYSTDGATWSQAQTTHQGYCRGGAFGNGVFVIGGGGVGGGTVMSVSTDGINWTQSTISDSAYVGNIIFVDGYFYALSGTVTEADVGKVYRSSDGVSWELISTTDLPSQKWSGFAYCPEKETFVCLRNEGSNGVYYTRNAYETATTLGDVAGEKVGGLSLIESGSYVGTGMFGKEYPNSLAFSIKPEVVIIMDETNSNWGSSNASCSANYAIFVRGVTSQSVIRESGNSSTILMKISWEDNTVSWKVDSEYNANYKFYWGQLNNSGVNYRYIAFGG